MRGITLTYLCDKDVILHLISIWICLSYLYYTNNIANNYRITMQGTKLTCLVYQKLKLKQNHLPQGTQTKIPCISKAKFKGQIQRKYIFFKFIYFISNIKKNDKNSIPYIFFCPPIVTLYLFKIRYCLRLPTKLSSLFATSSETTTRFSSDRFAQLI